MLKIKPFHFTLALIVTSAVATLLPDAAFAGTGGTALPWESALTTLQQALSGTTARIICLIAIFIAGVALVFGEDLGHFAKRLLMIVIASAFLIGAAGFVGFLSPNTGFTI